MYHLSEGSEDCNQITAVGQKTGSWPKAVFKNFRFLGMFNDLQQTTGTVTFIF